MLMGPLGAHFCSYEFIWNCLNEQIKLFIFTGVNQTFTAATNLPTGRKAKDGTV